MPQKMFAFAIAFFFTLAVAIVPLGIAELPNAEPRTPTVVEAITASFDYRIMPGFIPGEERIDSYLSLWRGNTLEAYDDDGGHWLDSKITRSEENVIAGATYTIEATTASKNSRAPTTGSFALTIRTCSDNEDYCPKENPPRYADSCTRDLTIKVNRTVSLTDKWAKDCPSQDGQRQVKKYRFTPATSMKITINLMGLVDSSHLPAKLQTPDQLTMTCGWHRICLGDPVAVSNISNRGIDFSTLVRTLDGRLTGDGTPVYLVIETLDGSKPIKAKVIPVPHPDDALCRRVEVEITGIDESVLAILHYTHVVALPELLAPEPFVISQNKDAVTVIEIGKTAMWPARGRDSAITENHVTKCGTAPHLHQGISSTYLRNDKYGWRNYDRLNTGNGLPGKAWQGFCIWSDTWVHAIQRHPTAKPKPTDRSKHGPNSTRRCPLRFFGAIADQSWASGQAVSLTVPEANGGNGSLTYSLQNCPHGLSIDSGSRVISGTPPSAASGTCEVVASEVVASDQSSVPSTTLSFSYTVTGGGSSPAPARDTSPSFPSGTTIDEQRWTQNSAITAFTLPSAEGGNSPLSYSLNEDFPDDVDVDDNHRVSGTPRQAMARKAYTWTATDADNDTASITFFVTIAAEPTTEPPPPAPTYRLTVEANPSSCGDASGTGDYPEGRKAPIKASVKPNVDCHFTGWTGDDIKDASSSSTEVTMGAAPKTVTANFTRECKLTMKVAPEGAGTTSPAAGSTHAYDPCEPSVALEAFAGSGFRFGSWDGAESASANPTTIALKAGNNKTVTANFVPTSCTLTVRVSPSGGGTTTPAVGTYRYSPCRTSVELTATANPGYRFVRWYGASGTSAKTNVALRDGDSKIVTARFAKQCTLTARSSPGGTVSGGGTFDCYTWKLLTATVTTGNSFARWTGDLSGSRNPAWIYLNTAKNVRAVFSCQVTVTAGTGGSVRGNGSPDCGTFWTVRAVHNDYHYLKRWIGDSRTSSSLRLYLVGNKTLRAVFDHVCNHPVYGVFCPVAGAEDESGAEP